MPRPPIATRRRSVGRLLLLTLLALTACAGPDRVSDVTPENASLRHGQDLLAAGDTTGAARQFRTASSSHNPRLVRVEAMIGLARCARFEEDLSGAVGHLKQAQPLAEGTSRYGVVTRLLAEIYLEMRSFSLSLHHAERAMEYAHAPRDRERLCFLLALIYSKQGDLGRARAYESQVHNDQPVFADWREVVFPPLAVPSEREPLPPIPEAPAPVRTPPALAFFSRSEWSARPTRGNVRQMDPIRSITVHHTGEADPPEIRSDADVAAYLRRLQRFDQTQRGWADVGYHFLICPRGKVFEGRSLHFQGAHAGNPELNRGNIGIALIGNFDSSRPSRAQVESLRRLIRNLRSEYRIAATQVCSHQTLKQRAGLPYTRCPGRHLQSLLPEIVGMRVGR